MSLYVYAAVGIGAAVVAAGGTWQVQEWRYGAKEAIRLEQQAKEQGIRLQRIDAAASGHEADKTAIRTEFITITETVERIVREPFYAPGAPACLDDDGMRELRAATGQPPASQPAGAVPRPSASH